MNSIQTIQRLAVIARQLAENADVGALETAGTLLSTLAEHPEKIEAFLASESILDDMPEMTHAEYGCLNFHSGTNPEVIVGVNTLRATKGLAAKESFKIDQPTTKAATEKPASKKTEDWNLEEIYDNEVSPLVTKIKDICNKHGMPFFCSFKYMHDDYCTSLNSEGSKDNLLRSIYALSRCQLRQGINIDNFFFYVMKEAREKGHSSIFLKQLKIPEVPASKNSEEAA